MRSYRDRPRLITVNRGLPPKRPDATQKRLGHGLYEQRLIRKAIVARTSQRKYSGNSRGQTTFLLDVDVVE